MNARALLASFLFVFIATNARAAWQLDGIPLCKDPAQQYAVTAAPDGSGGALVAWQDSRNAGGEDIYIRRIDADGGPMWALDGVPACLAPGDQLEPRIVGDGTGGAFVTWFDLRNGNDYDIYVQHVDASGVALWGAGGVAICTEPNDQVDARIVNDGSGGIVVVWLDDRAGVYARHVYGQRVDVTGVAQWTAQGIPICTASTYRSDMNIVTDGTGTFIVAWEDWYRIAYIQGFAQKVDATGGIGWFPDGIPLTLYNTPQASLSLVSDGAGGAIAAWQDARNAGGDDIYAQRVSAAGSLVWDPDGVAVCLVNGGSFPQYMMPRIVSDGANGAIISWLDYRNSANPRFDVYAQRMDAGGSPLWTVDGLKMCGAHNCNFLQMGGDGNGGAVMTWEDERQGDPRVGAQSVDTNGLVRWSPDGLIVNHSTAELPVVADAPDPIIAWIDDRGPSRDIYASVAMNTPEGSNVTIERDLPGGGTLTLTFDNVTTAGGTTVGSSGACNTHPGTFQWAPGGCLEVSTDATFSGSVTLCFTYDDTGLTPAREAMLKLMHYDAGVPGWVDVTTSLDTVENILCGTVTSLSPFAIATQTGVTGTGALIPTTFALRQNSPNPFNPMTTIHYNVPAGGANVDIAVYDAAGRLVKQLVAGHRGAGVWSVQWNGEDDRGAHVASGVYFYRMRAGEFVETKKMVLLK